MKVGDLVRTRIKSSDARIENQIGRITAVENECLFGFVEGRFGGRIPDVQPAITVSFPGGMVHTRAKLSHYVYA